MTIEWKRLDPLANAGPYGRLLKAPVKSFTLTEAQFNRLSESRPGLIAMEGQEAVIGHPYRDYLEVHYGFPDVETFRDDFAAMFNRCVSASDKGEAPRGVVLSFRDRPNRSLADTVFWSILLEEGPQWVELNWVAVPEQPEPEPTVAGGFTVREATDADRDAIAQIDGEVSGQPPLTPAGVDSIFGNARCLRVVADSAGAAVGFVSLHTEPGGWGIVDQIAVRPSALDSLREPLLRWSVAWLRNNGGRRIRHRVFVSQTEELALLRSLGFTPGETGLDYSRPTVDAVDVARQTEARKSHGTIIKFGDWR